MAKAPTVPNQPATQKRKIFPILGIVLLGLVLITAAVYFIGQQRAEAAYKDILTQLNNDQRAQVAYYAEESKELLKLRDAAKTISFDDPSKAQQNRDSLAEARRIATQVFDRMLDQCESYKEKYLHSSEIADSINTFFLPEEKQRILQDIEEMLTEKEDDSCSETKATIGKFAFDIDMSEAANNWMMVTSSDYTDATAISALKKFHDGSYQIPNRKEIEAEFTKGVVEAADLQIKLLAASYAYGAETNPAGFEAKYNAYASAYDALQAHSYYEEQLEQDRVEAKTSHQQSQKFYDLMLRANKDIAADTKFSANIYGAALVFSAISNYYADYEYSYPEAGNLDEVIKVLTDKRYFEQNEDLATDGLTYTAPEGGVRKLSLVDSFDDKTYELIIP